MEGSLDTLFGKRLGLNVMANNNSPVLHAIHFRNVVVYTVKVRYATFLNVLLPKCVLPTSFLFYDFLPLMDQRRTTPCHA